MCRRLFVILWLALICFIKVDGDAPPSEETVMPASKNIKGILKSKNSVAKTPQRVKFNETVNGVEFDEELNKLGDRYRGALVDESEDGDKEEDEEAVGGTAVNEDRASKEKGVVVENTEVNENNSVEENKSVDENNSVEENNSVNENNSVEENNSVNENNSVDENSSVEENKSVNASPKEQPAMQSVIRPEVEENPEKSSSSLARYDSIRLRRDKYMNRRSKTGSADRPKGSPASTEQTVAANGVQRRGSVRKRINEYEQERRAKAEAAAAKRHDGDKSQKVKERIESPPPVAVLAEPSKSGLKRTIATKNGRVRDNLVSLQKDLEKIRQGREEDRRKQGEQSLKGAGPNEAKDEPKSPFTRGGGKAWTDENGRRQVSFRGSLRKSGTANSARKEEPSKNGTRSLRLPNLKALHNKNDDATEKNSPRESPVAKPRSVSVSEPSGEAPRRFGRLPGRTTPQGSAESKQPKVESPPSSPKNKAPKVVISEGSSGEVKPKVDEPKRVAEDKPQEQTGTTESSPFGRSTLARSSLRSSFRRPGLRGLKDLAKEQKELEKEGDGLLH